MSKKSQQEQCQDIIVKATTLAKGEQIVLNFATSAERQSKKVMLHNAKKKVAKSIPDSANSITIRQGQKGNLHFITISKSEHISLKPILITSDGQIKTLDFSKDEIPKLPEGTDESQIPDRVKRLMAEETETDA